MALPPGSSARRLVCSSGANQAKAACSSSALGTAVSPPAIATPVQDPRNITVTQVFAQPAKAETPERALGTLLGRLDAERVASRQPPARRDARLMQLAVQQLAELDPVGSSESVEKAGRAIVAALDGRQAGSALLSVQVVPSSEKVAFPDALREAPTCSVGIAVRAVKAEHGRPALQVLLIVEQKAPNR
jgi:hypothetical protein